MSWNTATMGVLMVLSHPVVRPMKETLTENTVWLLPHIPAAGIKSRV